MDSTSASSRNIASSELFRPSNVRKEYDEEEIDDITNFIARADSKIHDVPKSGASRTSQRPRSGQRGSNRNSNRGQAGGLTGLDVGYAKRMTHHGFQKGDMISCGPTFRGKTAMALNIACMPPGAIICRAVFSLEMRQRP
jgi:hypothetical protein